MRFSKQREAVYQVLSSTNSHPDAAWIYSQVRDIIPNISIATVYRNLEELIKAGRIKRVSAEGYTERFDADIGEHAHLVCEKCGRIVDVDLNGVSVNYNLLGVTRCEITFYGCCDECRENKK